MKAIRPKKTRDLSKAVTLRPAEVFQAYGIPPATLRDWCIHKDAAQKLPSVLIQGRSGRKGVRLIKQADLLAYLERHAAP